MTFLDWLIKNLLALALSISFFVVCAGVCFISGILLLQDVLR